jgi:hypothetical protein
MAAHYLNVPGEEWEYVENDRSTGRPIRHKFAVPRLLDPKDKSCWTSRWGAGSDEEGEIIVCMPGKGDPKDQIFFGNPTPDMMPVDDEAKEISESFAVLWSYKPETDTNNYSQSLIDRFQLEAEVAKASAGKPATVEGLSELTAAIGQMVKQNAELLTSLRRV